MKISKVIVICLIMILIGVVTNALARGNDIIGFRVISASPNEIVMDVTYSYTGNFGTNIAIGAKMADDGKSSTYFGYGPGTVVVGQNKTTRVTLSVRSNAPDTLTTNQIELNMYIGGSYAFLQEFFPYKKTWTKLAALAAPKQVSPTNGTRFSNFPRNTTLAWNPVNGAKSYKVEIDCYHCCQSGRWCSEVGRSWKLVELTTTSYTFGFVGAQPGKWRVWAVYPDGKEGPKSDWWKFLYTR